MLEIGLVAVMCALLCVVAAVLAVDLFKNREKIGEEPGNPVLIALVAPVVLFFASMGISDFAMDTLFFKKCRLVDDKRLPGTLVCASTLPLGAASAAYILTVEVDFWLVVMGMVMQSVGAWLGVGLVSRLDGRKVKTCVAWAMLISSVFLLLRLVGVGGNGGNLTTLPLPRLLVFGVAAFFLGMGSMMAMGAKAPAMSVLLLLGLSPACVLPVIMSSCTASGISGGIRYIRQGLYQRKVVLLYATFGFLGVGAGFLFVMNLPQAVLQIVMMGIMIYTGISMLREK